MSPHCDDETKRVKAMQVNAFYACTLAASRPNPNAMERMGLAFQGIYPNLKAKPKETLNTSGLYGAA